MKTFITLKVGYTCGIYGCSGEYFNTIIIDGEKITNIKFEGMYGADDRINSALKLKGFTEHYICSDYGKLTRKDLPKNRFMSEHQVLDVINGVI